MPATSEAQLKHLERLNSLPQTRTNGLTQDEKDKMLAISRLNGNLKEGMSSA